MAQFIINKNAQSNGDHEVHDTTAGCAYLPRPENQIELGLHSSCHGAVALARQKWPNHRINGCYYCCHACHTT
jgi:hypothetical protein